MNARMHRSAILKGAVVALLSSLLTLGVVSVGNARGFIPLPREVRYALPPAAEAPNPFLAGGVAYGSNVPVYASSGTGPRGLNEDADPGTEERYIDPEVFPDGLPDGVSVTEAQGMNAMDRIVDNLAAQGLTLHDVTQMVIYLEAPEGADEADYAGWNRAYRKYFANIDRVTGEVIPGVEPVIENVVRPARSNIEVASLPVPGWLVEIEVVAAFSRR